MPQMKMKSQHWLFGLLGLVSIGSVFYTAFIGDIGPGSPKDRVVETQERVDTLTSDMKRFMQSISDWKSFCEDPYAYLNSASSHGNLAISVRDRWSSEEVLDKSRITRDAVLRCMKEKVSSHPGRIRICMTIKEQGRAAYWFDDSHLLEVNVEFREKGSKLVSSCEDIGRKCVEVQSYFSAYTDHGVKRKAGRVSGGVRLPLEQTRL